MQCPTSRAALVSLLALPFISFALNACKKEARTDPVAVASATGASLSNDAAPASAKPSEPPLSVEEKKKIRALLSEGRGLARKTLFVDAAAAFAKGDLYRRDGLLASELCYSAYKTGDLARAKAACEAGLRLAQEPNLRAQLLYNRGLVAESEKDLVRAENDFAQSIRLRPNEIVAKRLSALRANAKEPPATPCKGPFATTALACACLSKNADALLTLVPNGVSPKCSEETNPKHVLAKVVRLELPEDGPTSNVRIAFAKTKSGWIRTSAEARDYEPGAFGIHAMGHLDRFEEKDEAGRHWLLIHSSYDNVDTNAAGLEIYLSSAKLVTPCLVTDELTCGDTVPVVRDESLSYLEDAADLTADDRAWIAEQKKGAYSRHAETDVVLGADGSFTVSLKKGPSKDLEPGTLGLHRI